MDNPLEVQAEPASPEEANHTAGPWGSESKPSLSQRIFFGRFGFRAGWAIAIWLVFYFILEIVGSIFAVSASGNMQAARAARAHPGGPAAQIRFVPSLVLVQDGILFFGLIVLSWFFSRAERRPFGAFGIGRSRIKDLLPGALLGLIVMSLLILTLKSLHLLIFDGQMLHGAAIIRYGTAWLIAFLLVGFAEEYSFRGYLQYTLTRGVWGLAEKLSATHTRAFAFTLASFITCLIFVLLHMGNGGENFFGLVQVFLAGVTFCYALWRTGSLWWGIGFHATWDWTQSFLFGVADSGNISVGRLFATHPAGKTLLSGGTAGPEGSIFASVALLLTMAALHFVPRGVQPALDPEPPLIDVPPSIL